MIHVPPIYPEVVVQTICIYWDKDRNHTLFILENVENLNAFSKCGFAGFVYFIHEAMDKEPPKLASGADPYINLISVNLVINKSCIECIIPC